MPDFALVSSKYEDALASANSAAASRAQILLDRTGPVCRTRGSPLVRALADLRSTQMNRRSIATHLERGVEAPASVAVRAF